MSIFSRKSDTFLSAAALSLLLVAGVASPNIVEGAREWNDPHPAKTMLEAVGGDWEDVIWTADPVLNCGARASLEKGGSAQGGCYRYDTPGKLYVSPGLNKGAETYIVLHEYAHSLGYRNECDADAQAIKWGASADYSYYRVTGQCAGGSLDDILN